MGLASVLAAQAATAAAPSAAAPPAGGCSPQPTGTLCWPAAPLTAPAPALVPVAPVTVLARLQQTVACNELSAFYSPGAVQDLAQRLAATVDYHALAARWRMPLDSAVSLSSLALYDVVLYADDSGSMESDNGERIDDLKLIVAKVAEVATLFDDDGIEVRFINADLEGNNIRTPDDVNRLIGSVTYNWDTKLATQLEARILGPMAYARRLAKPLLVVTVTDGEPSDSPKDKIVSVVKECAKKMEKQGLGRHAVAFQFAQVGRDRSAQEFLASLDDNPKVGSMIDCTSYFELEQAEYAAKGISLSVEAWLVKLMMGAIDMQLDRQDEAGTAPHTKKAKRGLLDKLFA